MGVAELSILFAICGPQLRAQQRPDFSGHYIHRADKSPYILNSLTVRLTVTQNAETLEVVMTFEGGKSTKNGNRTFIVHPEDLEELKRRDPGAKVLGQ